MFNIGIIGCGLIGKKRALSLGSGKLVACFDICHENAKSLVSLSDNPKVEIFEDIDEFLDNKKIDIVIIATLHDSLAKLTIKCLKASKHVIVEKPASRNYKELKDVINYANSTKFKVHVGFNHRYHRAMQKAKSIIEEKKLGELMFIRARYGHGGRLGYEKEWRSNKDISGGGELIDQGPHLIDLSQWFFGEKLKYHSSIVKTAYWEMSVDDNAFLLLETEKNKIASLHVSCTEWKNTFSFEIYGKKGKLDISGLGGSYGVEKLSHYNMLPEMGPPETFIYEYPMKDNSWEYEVEEFYKEISENRESTSSLLDAANVLEIIDLAYSNKS